MGHILYLAHVTQDMLDRIDLMFIALHSLLSSKGIFKGECEDFCHLVLNSKGNEYLVLYQIVHMVHPTLEQATTQPSQPAQKKAHSFYDHVANYIDYLQSESCSVINYTINKQVFLFISCLDPILCNVMQRKYKQLVQQHGRNQPIPLECHIEMISVTLFKRCTYCRNALCHAD
jgi:hypothetical protein